MRKWIDLIESLEVKWAPQHASYDPADYAVVTIDVEKLAQSWEKDRFGYVDGPDHENAIGKRYDGFGEWFTKGEAVEMPLVAVSPWGHITFGNGRHRFSWLRNKGVKSMPVMVPAEQKDEIEQRFGVSAPALTEGYREYLGRTVVEHLWTFCEWLNGDAMNLVNDDGERFSPAPYYASMVALSKIVPPTRLRQLSGFLYRGASSNKPLPTEPGLVKTASKQFQSWSPSKKAAKEFTKFSNYGGTNAVLYHASVDKNRRRIVLSVQDVLAWVMSKPEGIEGPDLEQAIYTLESFAHQDEIIVRGTAVDVEKAEIIRRPGS